MLFNRAVAAGKPSPWRCRLIAEQSVCIVGPPGLVEDPFCLPKDLQSHPVLLSGPSSDIRSQFDLVCEAHGIDLEPYAEVDDMAMLRLLVWDSGGLSLVPEFVVQDELLSGKLKKYYVLKNVKERFYAITAKRHFELVALRTLLEKSQESVMAASLRGAG